MPYLEDLILYYKVTCPYCRKVLRFMDESGISLELRDVTQPGIQDELVGIGGSRQVPCLIIDGEALYESEDIIAYLRTRLA